MTTDYTPQPRTKLQFARLFVSTDEMSDRAVLRWLQREICSNPQLYTMLVKMGYKPSAKYLTIAQQTLIIDAFCLKLNVN